MVLMSLPVEVSVNNNLLPCIIALVGPPFMGKSTLGQAIAENSNAQLLDVDQSRWEIFPRKGRLSNIEEMFSLQTAYQKTHEKSRDSLLAGIPVVLTATYSRDLYHRMLKDLALKTASPLRVFHLYASEAEILRRIEERTPDNNPSTTFTLEHFLDDQRRFTLIPDVDVTPINTDLPTEQNLVMIFQTLKDLQIR